MTRFVHQRHVYNMEKSVKVVYGLEALIPLGKMTQGVRLDAVGTLTQPPVLANRDSQLEPVL